MTFCRIPVLYSAVRPVGGEAGANQTKSQANVDISVREAVSISYAQTMHHRAGHVGKTPVRAARETALAPAGARSNDGKGETPWEDAAGNHRTLTHLPPFAVDLTKTPLKSALKKPLAGAVAAHGSSPCVDIKSSSEVVAPAVPPFVPSLRQFGTATSTSSSCGTLNSVGATVVSAATAEGAATPRVVPNSLRRLIQPVPTGSTPRLTSRALDNAPDPMSAPVAIASAAVAITPAAGAPTEPLSVLEGQIPIVRHASASAARIASGQSAIEAFRRAFQGLSSPPTPHAAASPALRVADQLTPIVAPPLLPNRHVPIPPGQRLAQNGQPRTPAPLSPPPAHGGQTPESAMLGSHGEKPADAALESGLAPLSQPAGASALPGNKRGGPSHALRSRWRFTLRAIGRAHRARPSSTSSMAPQAGTLRGLAPIPAESLGTTGAGPATVVAAAEGRAMYDDFTDSAAGMPDLSSPRASPTTPPSSRGDRYDLSTSPVGGEQVVFGVSSDAVNAVASSDSTPPSEPLPSTHEPAVAGTPDIPGHASVSLISPAVPITAAAAVPTLPTPRSPSLRPPPHTPAGARLTGRSHRQLQASAAGDMGAPDDSPVQRRNTVAPGEQRTPARLTSPLGPSAGSGLRHRTPVATGLGNATAGAGGFAMRSLSRHHLEEEKQALPRMRYSDDDASSEGGESVVGEPPRTSIGDLTAYGAQHVSDDDEDCFDSVSQAGGGGGGGTALSPQLPAASPLAQSTRRATALASPPGSFRRGGVLASPTAGLAAASAATLPLGSPAVLPPAPTAAPPHLPGTEGVQSPHARHPVPDGDGDGVTLQASDSLPAAAQWLPESLQPLAQAAIVASRRRVRPTPKYRQSHLDNVDDRGAYDFAIVVRAVFSAKQAAALARAKADADARAAAALVQARNMGWTSPTKTAVPAPAASAAPSTASRRHRGVVRMGTAARANDDDDESRDSASLSDSDNLSDSSDGSRSGPRKLERLPRRHSPPAGKTHARRTSLTDEDDDYDHSSEDDDSLARSPSRRRGRGRAGDSDFESALPSSDSGSGETSESSSGGDGDAVTHAARRGGGRGNSIGTFLAGLSPWGRLAAPTDAARARNGHKRPGGDDFRLSSSSSAAVGLEASLSDAGTGVAASSLRRVTFSNTEASHARADMDANESASSPPGSGAHAHVVVELPTVPAASTRSHKCSEILAALRGAGLQAKRVRSLSRRTWLIKLRASEARLEEEAEAMHLRLRRRDGGWSRFRRSARVAFLPVIAENGGESAKTGGNEKRGERRRTIFHSSDRQLLINHILRSSSREGGCDLGEGSPLGAYVTHMMPLHMRARLDELRNDWLATWRPAISQGAHDRIGDIDPSWYAPPVLVSIDTAATADRPQAAASAAVPPTGGGVWLQRLRASLGGAQSSTLQQDDSSGSAAPAHVQAVPPRDRCDIDPSTGSPTATAGGDDRRRRPPRHPRCCMSICSTISCAFCCGPVVLAWVVISIASCSARCARSLSRCCSRLTTQPLDRIASYFGESIAFYFAWLEFYTNWLVFPAVIGALLFVGQLYWGEIDIAYAPLFSLFVALWAILLLEFWKRRNAELAQRWGVLHYEDEEIVS